MVHIHISNRAHNIPASGIRKLMPLAMDAKKRGIHIYHVNIGQPDLHTPEKVLSYIKSADLPILEYAPSPGMPETVEAWKTFYKKKGFHLESNQIVVTSGGAEALQFAFFAIADPDDELLVFEPFYTSYAMFAAMGNIRLHPVTTYGEQGFHLPPVEQIEQAITNKTKAILLCNPNNPTGTLYTPEEISLLCDLAIKHDLFIISDETYQELVYDGKDNLVLGTIGSIADRLIVVDSVSKRFNACGSRVGCVASKNSDVMTAVLRFAQARLAVATIDQLSVVPMLNDADAYITELKQTYERRRNTVIEGLKQIPGVTFVIPEGAFYIIPQLPVDDADEFAKFLLSDFSDNNETVMVSPASGFYSTPGLGKKEIRIAYILDEKKLKRAMELLKLAIEQYTKH